ncbi:MAG TPA: glutathione S-transferase family protein [Xanthobacteraceae bacterium]|nr:glutathione S-transferase family protein [Xanthobacteraceae bacterium]
MALTLLLGNKNYSSWSMRPYLALAHHKVPFEEIVVPLYEGDYKQAILKYSPAGKVPVLIDGDIAVWESLAILDHLAEKFPKLALWPADPAARAYARAISAEMHAGFAALRQACPMNLKRAPKPIALSPEAVADIARVAQIWNDARKRFGKGGDFLFGEFSAADCMYAPVATRFRTYAVEPDPVSAAYVEAIHRLPAFIAWREAGLKEPWSMKKYDAL